MLIQLMRLEDVDPTYLIQRSFMQFQTLGKTPQFREKLEKLNDELQSIVLENDKEIGQYYQFRQSLAALQNEFRKFQNLPKYIIPWYY